MIRKKTLHNYLGATQLISSNFTPMVPPLYISVILFTVSCMNAYIVIQVSSIFIKFYVLFGSNTRTIASYFFKKQVKRTIDTMYTKSHTPNSNKSKMAKVV
jgi:hypothetical protein